MKIPYGQGTVKISLSGANSGYTRMRRMSYGPRVRFLLMENQP